MKNTIIGLLAAALVAAVTIPGAAGADEDAPADPPAPATSEAPATTAAPAQEPTLATLAARVTTLETDLAAEAAKVLHLQQQTDRRRVPLAAGQHVIYLPEGFPSEPYRDYRFCFGDHVTVRLIGPPQHHYFAKIVDGNLHFGHDDHTRTFTGQIEDWGGVDILVGTKADPNPRRQNVTRTVSFSQVVQPSALPESPRAAPSLSLTWGDTCRHLQPAE